MITAKYKLVDGIYLFHEDIEEKHSDYCADGINKLHLAEKDHFWFKTRNEFILKTMESFIAKESKLVEVGAGSGTVSAFLKQSGYHNITVADMHLSSLKFAKNHGINKLIQFDLMRNPFEDEFDVVMLFDVLEHIQDDLMALGQIYKMLRQSGSVVLTVPAHNWLWHEGNRAGGHKRRYGKKELRRKLNKTGFNVIAVQYFFISLVPLMLLRKVYSQIQTKKSPEDLGLNLNPFFNTLLRTVTKTEISLINFLPNIFGASIIAVAQKNILDVNPQNS